MNRLVLSICIGLLLAGCATSNTSNTISPNDLSVITPPNVETNASANTIKKVEFFAVVPPSQIVYKFNIAWQYSNPQNLSNVMFQILGTTDFINWSLVGEAKGVINMTFSTTNSLEFFKVIPEN